MTLSDAERTERLGWYARLIDACLSESEFARWERLRSDGLTPEMALTVVLRGRESDSKREDA